MPDTSIKIRELERHKKKNTLKLYTKTLELFFLLRPYLCARGTQIRSNSLSLTHTQTHSLTIDLFLTAFGKKKKKKK